MAGSLSWVARKASVKDVPEGQGQALQLSYGKSIPGGGNSKTECPEAWFVTGSSGAGEGGQSSRWETLLCPSESEPLEML